MFASSLLFRASERKEMSCEITVEVVMEGGGVAVVHIREVVIVLVRDVLVTVFLLAVMVMIFVVVLVVVIVVLDLTV